MEFVRLLHEKWFERNPQTLVYLNSPSPTLSRNRQSRRATAFLSATHSEDYEAAGRLRDTLHQLGLNVWMDKKGGLEAGNLNPPKSGAIYGIAHFYTGPLQNAECRKEAFFREEWDDALKRMRRFKGSSRPFIVPVVSTT